METAPEPAPESPRRVGRPAMDPSKRRASPVVSNLTEAEHEKAKAWAKGQGRPLGECIRALLLPLIGACLILCAGCAGAMSAASVIAAAKPILDVSCHVVSTTCDAIEAACSYAGAGPSSGGESAPAADADAGVSP